MKRIVPMALVILAFAGIVAACGGDDSGAPRREVTITQTDDSCSPASIEATAGEKLKLVVKNEGKKDKEVEGIDGTRLEELLVPAGRTRNLNFDVPKNASTQKIKCYTPGGASTIIEVKVSGQSSTSESPRVSVRARTTTKAARDEVSIELMSYGFIPDKTAVAAGPTRFVATNTSPAETHELALLRVKGDGSYENMGEIEDLAPGKSGEIVLDLPRGGYLLACLIVPGQAGSKEDHFQRGMRLDFEVTGAN